MKWKPFTKRLLSLLLAAVMLAGTLPMTSLAAETEDHVHSAEPQAEAQPAVEAQAAQPAENQAAAQPNATYTYTLTFDGNGEGVTGVPPARTATVSDPTYGFGIDFKETESIERPGYNFLGWNAQADGKGTYYRPGMTAVPVDKDHPDAIVYAQWEASAPTPPAPPIPTEPTEYTYQLIYDDGVDDGSVTGMPTNQSSDKTDATSFKFKIPSGKPVRVGYDFKGWVTNTGKTYQAGSSVTLYSDSPTLQLTAKWQTHVHTWKYTMNSDGKEGTHNATCTASWCDAKIENEAHLWDTGYVSTQPTFTKTGIRTYTCQSCKTATYTEDVPVKVPTPPVLKDLKNEFMVQILENCKLDAEGNPVPGLPQTWNSKKWYWPIEEDQYALGELTPSEDGETIYCDVTIKASTIQSFFDTFSLEYEDDTWAFDWMHSDIKSLQDVTLTMYCKSNQGWQLTPKYGINIYVYHTNHENTTGSDWTLDAEKNVMRARCRHNNHYNTQDYRCNVILYEPVAPDVQPLIDQLDKVKLYVDGVETKILPETILTTKASVGGDETGWYTYVSIDGEKYLGECQRFASGQPNKPSIRFKLVPGEGDDSLHGTWVLDQTTVEIKTVPFHTFSIVEITKEPTCAKGEKTYTCEKCGETKVEELPAVAEHVWGDWGVTQQPTPEKEGLKERTCTVCGEKESEVLPKTMPAPPTEEFLRTLYRGFIINAVENYNVLEDGTAGAPKTISGINCKHVQFSAEPGTYTLSEVQMNEGGEYYCTLTVTEDGLQYYAECFEDQYGDSVDRYAIDTLHTDAASYTYTLKWNGHAWAYVEENGFNAAAGKDLYMVHTRHSSNDSWTTVTEATCTTAGERTRRCSHLAAARATQTRCKYVIREIIPATGHTWGNWVITDATCTEDGKKVRTCSGCGITEEEIIPATGTHTWGEWSVDDKNHTRECSVCHKTETGKHKWESKVTIPPTLTSDGLKTYTCSVCNHTKTEVMAAPVPLTSDMVESNSQPGLIYVQENYTASGKKATYVGTGGRQITSRKLMSGTYSIGDPYEEDGNFYCVVTITDIQAYLKAFQAAYTDAEYTIDTTFSTSSYRYVFKYDGYDFPNDPCPWRYSYMLNDETGRNTNHLWIIHAHYSDDMTVDTPATCTTPGSQSGACQHSYKPSSTSSTWKCKTKKFTEEIPATGHTWGEWTPEEENHTRECTVCNEKVTEAHNWDEGTVTAPPTPTTEGVRTYTCTVCHKQRTEAIDKLAPDVPALTDISTILNDLKIHVICGTDGAHSHDPKLAVTDLTIGEPVPGENGTFTCDVTLDCGKYLSKCHELAATQNRTVVIRLTWIPVGTGTGGNWTLSTTSITIYQNCAAHTWDEGKVTKAPTCTEEGVKTYTCTVCGETRTEKLAVIDHTWDGEKITEEATCTEEGKIYNVCSVCGEKQLAETIPALGHDFSEKWTVDTKPTCTEEGSKSRHCSRCDATTDVTVIPATGHNWGEGVVVKDPTYTEEGVMSFTCKNDASHTKTEPIEKRIPDAPNAKDVSTALRGLKINVNCGVDSAHNQTRDLIATSLSIGKLTSGENNTFTCDVTMDCSQYLSKNHALAATQNETVTITLTWTPSESGWTGSWTTDTTSVTIYQTCIPHSWDEGKVTKAPTCTEDGVKTYTCSTCGETRTETLPATGHKWDEGKVTKEPTATEDGEMTYTCTVCGETRTEKLPATGHKWDEGKVTKEPTCTEDGVKTYTCSTCGETRTETLPATGHKWDGKKVTEEATCTEEGKVYDVCSLCGEKQLTDIIPATGHNWGEGVVTKAPTYTQEGVMTFTCKNDTSHTKTESIAKLVPTTPNVKDVSEVLRGLKINVNCVADNAHSQSRDLIATGLTVSALIPGENDTFTCTVTLDCSLYLSQNHELAATQDKTVTITLTWTPSESGWTGAWTTDTTNVTIYQSCVSCVAHNWDEGKVTKEPTCTEEGEKAFTCTVCGETRPEKLAAIGHDWDEGKVTTKPTCTKEGVKTYTCKHDATHTKTEAIPMVEHDYSNWAHNDSKHWRECDNCDKKQEGGHYDRNNNGKCDVCGAKMAKGDTAPKTGDPAPITLMVTVLLISAAGICIVILYCVQKKKSSSK